MYAYVPTLIITNKHTGKSDEFSYGIWFNDLSECTDYFLSLNYELESLNYSSLEDEYCEIARFTVDADGGDYKLTVCIDKYRLVSVEK